MSGLSATHTGEVPAQRGRARRPSRPGPAPDLVSDATRPDLISDATRPDLTLAREPEPRTEPGSLAQAGSRAQPAQPPEGRHRRPPDPRGSYGAVFRIREFRWLATAQALSFLGDQFAQVAIALLVFGRTGSALLTAVAYALTYLPPIVGGPLLSGLADRFPRRRVMVICDVIRVPTVGLMAVEGMPFWALCTLLVVTVLLGTPFFSARAALLPDILPPGQLGIGAAISNIVHQSTQILGFVAGAAVVAALGPYRTLQVDALTFVLSAVIALIALKPRPAPSIPPVDGQEHPAGHARTARHRRTGGKHTPPRGVPARQPGGLRIVFRSRTLRTLVFFGWLAGFYVIPEGLAAPYARTLGGSEITVGLLMASVPAGTALGAMLIGRLARPSSQLWSMGWLAIMSCAPLVVSLWDPPLWVVLPLWVLAGVGGAFQIIAIPAFSQALTPQTRGRAFGVAQSGLYAVQGLGILAGGVLANAFGAPAAVGLAGGAGVLTATGLALFWTRLRRAVIASQRPPQAALTAGRADS